MPYVTFSLKYQVIEKIDLFSQGTEDCQNVRCESLIIVDSKCIEISSLAVLNIK